MKLLFKQRLFSWLSSYDVYNEYDETVYQVEGKLAWGHKLEIHDAAGIHVGTVREEKFSLLPRFAIYVGDRAMGYIRKEFTFFKPVFTLDCNGWQVEGDWMGWDYYVNDPHGNHIMHASKQLMRMTDTYVIDVEDPQDALLSLMIVLAIDAAKASSNNS